jgi:hypothetical protein
LSFSKNPLGVRGHGWSSLILFCIYSLSIVYSFYACYPPFFYSLWIHTIVFTAPNKGYQNRSSIDVYLLSTSILRHFYNRLLNRAGLHQSCKIDLALTDVYNIGLQRSWYCSTDIEYALFHLEFEIGLSFPIFKNRATLYQKKNWGSKSVSFKKSSKVPSLSNSDTLCSLIMFFGDPQGSLNFCAPLKREYQPFESSFARCCSCGFLVKNNWWSQGTADQAHPSSFLIA